LKKERKLKSKRKRKHSVSESKGPVQLSKFIKDVGKEVRGRSAVSGKVIKMKVKKSKGDKERDINRRKLLEFLNASV
jgi:hypothetical protein